jgi:hypothetical protein
MPSTPRMECLFLSYAIHFDIARPDAEPTDENLAAALAGCARKPSPAWLEAIRGYVHEYRRNPDIQLRIKRDGRSGGGILVNASDAQIGA